MNWNQIRYVIVTAEEKNMTRAAEKLFISQPSLSISISQLEEELGQRLFERKGKGVELTYAGQIFLDWAQTVDASMLRLNQRLLELREGQAEKICIGLSPHRSVLISPALLKKVQARYPALELEIVERPAAQLQTMLEEDSLDMIVDVPLENVMTYHYEEITEEGLCLLAPAAFSDAEPFSKLKPGQEIDLSTLADYGFILTPQGSMMGQAAGKMLELSGITPRIICRCSMSETIRNMVEEGLGVAILSDAFYHTDLARPGVCCYKIKNCHFSRKIGIAYKQVHYHSQIFYDLVGLIKETFLEIYVSV